ncbi:MAG: hypothetical protein P1U68_10230 [Verrucomicrobiales bacterium]|nr:hypothetical protein [Verrucomicrobiales bacterium]
MNLDDGTNSLHLTVPDPVPVPRSAYVHFNFTLFVGKEWGCALFIWAETLSILFPR